MKEGQAKGTRKERAGRWGSTVSRKEDWNAKHALNDQARFIGAKRSDKNAATISAWGLRARAGGGRQVRSQKPAGIGQQGFNGDNNALKSRHLHERRVIEQ